MMKSMHVGRPDVEMEIKTRALTHASELRQPCRCLARDVFQLKLRNKFVSALPQAPNEFCTKTRLQMSKLNVMR